MTLGIMPSYLLAAWTDIAEYGDYDSSSPTFTIWGDLFTFCRVAFPFLNILLPPPAQQILAPRCGWPIFEVVIVAPNLTRCTTRL